MSVNFILINGVAKQAEENYKNFIKEGYNKDFVAKSMEEGDYASASKNLFDSDSFKEIFKEFQKPLQFDY